MTAEKKRLSRARQGEIIALLGEGVTFHGDGSVTAKVTYFYRHGRSADQLAAKVIEALPGSTILGKGDKWAPWPKDSYFWVKFIPAFSEGA